MADDPEAPIELAALRKRALAATLAIWAAVTALQLIAYKLSGLPIGAAGWISVGTTFPLVMLVGYGLFEAVRKAASSGSRRGLVWIAAGLLLASVLVGAFDAIKDHWLMEMLPPAPTRPLPSAILGGIVYHLLLFGILAAVFEAWIEGALRAADARALAVAREAEAEARLAATQAEAAAVEARLAALRYQLNPHFLFNTLNAISSMVVTGRNSAAEGMLERLCEFLRTTLSGKSEGLVPLEDELATTASYLEIESFRLRERLVVEFDCPAELNGAFVPGFLLQPLVENAIRHGVGRTSRPVRLAVVVAPEGPERLAITVRDDAAPDLATVPLATGMGLGLANATERLQSLFGESATLNTEQLDPGFAVHIRIPLVRDAKARAA